MTSTIAILGASGLVGRAIIGELGTSGDCRLALIGRDANRLKAAAAAAANTGSTSSIMPIGDDGDWHTILERVARPDLVLNLVGPANDTAAPVRQWCLRNGAHYCDVANELEAVRGSLGSDDQARRVGVSVLTGAGFGVVATEALVLALRGDRPPARSARVVAMPGMADRGRNVAASAVEVLTAGGRAYRGGALTATRPGAAFWRIPTPSGANMGGVGVAVGDLESARRASGADDVDAYTAEIPTNAVLRAALPALAKAARWGAIRRALEYGVTLTDSPGPAADGDDYVSLSYAQLDWANGETRAGWLRMGDGYAFSGKVAATAVRAQLAGEVPPGAHTPAAVLGPQLAYQAGATLVIDQANSTPVPRSTK
ncbi:MAG TPA: saccharopine dehydrogenase NADP-binding domain-containing protein [Mycobacterium sp.]|nr:saccharopine dehydrogenase NADP-binding domain-containing protein [Mycobacterium sp.]